MRWLKNFIIFIAVLLSWILMFYYFGIINSFALTPWDTAIFRPDIGTWQRTLNDFFEVGFGHNLIFISIALFTALPILKTLHRRWNTALRIIVANLLFVFLGAGVFVGISYVNNNLFFPIHSGFMTDTNPFLYHNYARSILPMIFYWLTYFIWYRELNSLGKHRTKSKNKAKNTDYQHAIKRLRDENPQEAQIGYQDNLASSGQLRSQ